MWYDFIEIGTSDFDTLIQTTEGKIGLSIEPLKFYLDKLPKNKNVIKVNCAISNKNGTTTVYWVNPEDIQEYNLPIYLRGCNSINRPHKTTMRLLIENDLEFLMKETECEMITWNNLVNRYDVEGVDFLKLDTEGHDCVIINNMLDSNINVLPNEILFESNELTNPKFLNLTIERLLSYGYEIKEKGEWDIIVKRTT
jgi:FkbM family methyltransferase